MQNKHSVVWTGIVGIIFVCTVFSPTLHYKLGNIFFGGVSSLYNVTLAEFFFERATKPIVGDVPPYAYHQLSRTHFIQGEFDASIAEAYREIELYPEHLHTYYIIGLTLGYMHREEEAIEAFGKFIEYLPTSWAARNDRAWLQFRIGEIDGALETMEPIVGSVDNPWVQNTYGTLLMNVGRYDEAGQAFAHAKRSADTMTEETWGSAYPGNDPRIYETGLQAMRKSIQKNIELLTILNY